MLSLEWPPPPLTPPPFRERGTRPRARLECWLSRFWLRSPRRGGRASRDTRREARDKRAERQRAGGRGRGRGQGLRQQSHHKRYHPYKNNLARLAGKPGARFRSEFPLSRKERGSGGEVQRANGRAPG